MSHDDPSTTEAAKQPARTFKAGTPEYQQMAVPHRAARRFSRVAALSVACALVSACTRGALYDPAVQSFSRINLCPVNRIAARQVKPPPPPADIAEDPERLSMWQTRRSGLTFYFVDGCGQSIIYRCYWGGCKVDF